MQAIATGSTRVADATTRAAALTALGIVYGDLGTSPLYTLQTIVQTTGGTFTEEVALGSLSLIFWSLIITISIKYCLFVMRADNHGEGGILALMSLTGARARTRGHLLLVMGLFGAALIYGDGIITPAISVLSALEGLQIATPAVKPYVTFMAVAVLVALFAVQHRGTARLGKTFGPLMLLWFTAIAILGVAGLLGYPAVLTAADPRHGWSFLAGNGWTGFAVLGGVFLAITGGEALYADMGHIGRNPIRSSWYLIVLPALLLSYAGQTAYVMGHPGVVGNPFFMLTPQWALYPMVGLATVATIIASQAIITGTFSLTRQAMQLGWSPGLRIFQTSSEEYGQIYVPFVNWTMMGLTVALALGFGSSDRLAGAYGTAVSLTMLLTSGLLFSVMRHRWGWSLPVAVAVSGGFLVVDTGFFAANLLKLPDGGFIPLAFGSLVFLAMTTWRYGMDVVRERHATGTERPEQFFGRIARHQVPRVPGTAVFITRALDAIPALIVAHVEQMGAIQQSVVALTVKFEEIPRVAARDRVEVVAYGDQFWHVTVRYGFVEIPDLPAALRQAKGTGCPLDLSRAIYFGSRDTVVAATGRRARLARWRVPIFAFMLRNSVRPVDLFNIPPTCFVEIGRQLEI